MNKESKRYFGDLDSKPTGVEFVPEDLEDDSGLLPKRIQIPLSLGLLVQVTESNNLVYYAPDDIKIEDINKVKKQLQEELAKPSPIKKAY